MMVQKPACRFACLSVLLSALASPVAAHDWYPFACCSNNDCYPVDGAVEVTPTAKGWVIRSTGEVIGYGDARLHVTPNFAHGDYHRCSTNGKPQGKTICLFVPQVGS